MIRARAEEQGYESSLLQEREGLAAGDLYEDRRRNSASPGK